MSLPCFKKVSVLVSLNVYLIDTQFSIVLNVIFSLPICLIKLGPFSGYEESCTKVLCLAH